MDLNIEAQVIYIGSDIDFGAVFINWTENAGNFDPSYYIVYLLVNNLQITSVDISAERMEFPTYSSAGIFGIGSTPAVLLPVILPEGADTDIIQINAMIRTTSKCGQTSDGFLTEMATVMRSGGEFV